VPPRSAWRSRCSYSRAAGSTEERLQAAVPRWHRGVGRDEQAEALDALSSIAHLMNEFWIAGEDVRLRGEVSDRPTVRNRSDAVAQIAEILAGGLGSDSHPTAMADTIVGEREWLTDWQALQTVSRAEKLIYDGLRLRGKGLR